MKTVTAGDGKDSTTAVRAYLAAGNTFRFANMFMFGEADWPGVFRITDYESPLLWRPYGLFLPSNIKRGTVSCKIGLDVSSLEISYSPTPDYSVYKTAIDGYYDNWPVRVWTAFMPTSGDVETYGCAELFGGRIGPIKVDRGEIVFTVNSFLDVINQSLPNQTIELTNPLLAYESTPAEDWGFPYVPKPELGML
jgi:hypothetical protein